MLGAWLVWILRQPAQVAVNHREIVVEIAVSKRACGRWVASLFSMPTSQLNQIVRCHPTMPRCTLRRPVW